jgi:Domain of unknown function (DUF4145)
MADLNWHELKSIGSKSYTCGYCGNPLASEKGYWATDPHGKPAAYLYVCHYCGKPSFFDPRGDQTPGVAFGRAVEGILEESVAKLYDEARRATSAGAYTAAVLCLRKLLMHVAVSKGAREGQDFSSYVQYLLDHGYVPPDAKEWVDHIRQKGNEANHEIAIMPKDDAEELISFAEMLLKVIFEFPSKMKKKAPPQ